MAQVNGEPKYESYKDGMDWKTPLKILWKHPVLIYQMAEDFKNFDRLKSTFRTTKLLYLTFWTPTGLCLVEINFRPRNYI